MRLVHPAPGGRPAPMVPAPHASLWLQTGDIVLQAGDTLFKLESSVLRAESQFFADMLDVGHRGTEEGTEARPLAVVGVAAAAFTDTIRMAYDPNALCDPISGYVGVLHVAHRFQFDRVQLLARHRLAVDHASTAEAPLLMLHAALSGRCGVDSWAFCAFEELALARSSHFPADISLLHANVQRALTVLRAAMRQKRLSMAQSAALKLTCQGHWSAFRDVVDQGGGFAAARRCVERLRNGCMRCLHVSNAVHTAHTGAHCAMEGILRRAFSRAHEPDMVVDAWREVIAGECSSDDASTAETHSPDTPASQRENREAEGAKDGEDSHDSEL